MKAKAKGTPGRTELRENPLEVFVLEKLAVEPAKPAVGLTTNRRIFRSRIISASLIEKWALIEADKESC